jgi:hypothetical protein
MTLRKERRMKMPSLLIWSIFFEKKTNEKKAKDFIPLPLFVGYYVRIHETFS